MRSYPDLVVRLIAPPAKLSEFRSEVVGLNAELLNRVLRRNKRSQVDVDALIGAPSMIGGALV